MIDNLLFVGYYDELTQLIRAGNSLTLPGSTFKITSYDF
jgi:hypothetical protein